MPVALSYPGVYIQEIPSSVRTITGVATSIAAFIGRAKRGPDNEPVVINSYGDFEKIFGGLWEDSTLGFAVRDFYQNGGRQAVIVRLENSATSATVKLADGIELQAVSKGVWGNKLKVTVEDGKGSEEVAKRLGVTKEDLFNLIVQENSPNGVSEKHLNLTTVNSRNRIDKILELNSNLLRYKGEYPKSPPTVTKKDTSAEGGADGGALDLNSYINGDHQGNKTGLYSLEKLYATGGLFNILCLPPYEHGDEIGNDLIAAAVMYCENRRAMLLVDPPKDWLDKKSVIDKRSNLTRSKNAVVFFPRVKERNPLRSGAVETFVPCGVMAGVFARTDVERGVWKSPAGIAADLRGIAGLDVLLTDEENGELNQLGINCLRSFPAAGNVAWGARTVRGDDQLADEWKYLSVRRTTLFIQESLYRGTQWVVFEPNDEPLWSMIRFNVGNFMNGLFRQGAFQGKTPDEAYFVKCDSETTTKDDIDRGIVNIQVGFSPLKPAEFVVISIQQIAS